MACPALNVPAILGVCCASIFSALAQTPLTAEVDRAVEQMRGMSMTIQAAGRMTGREAKRRAITKQLHDLGPAAIFALARLLHDGDVQMRQNAALVLSNLGGGPLSHSHDKPILEESWMSIAFSTFRSHPRQPWCPGCIARCAWSARRQQRRRLTAQGIV